MTAVADIASLPDPTTVSGEFYYAILEHSIQYSNGTAWAEAGIFVDDDTIEIDGTSGKLQVKDAGVVATTYAPDHATVGPGSEVALLPPVSGGAPGGPGDDEAWSRGVFELWEQPLDLPALEARVRDPRCGAVVSFVGTTRDTHKGRRVLRLEYEAFEAMTGPEMGRIFADVRAACGEVQGGEPRMLCVHRVGTVEVGEPSEVERPPLSEVKTMIVLSATPSRSSASRSVPTASSMLSIIAA